MTMQSFRLTGRHILAIFLAFFAVVIGVNILMASFAVSGFGGTVVDNSYVASQRFNGWLDTAKAQRALGWRYGVTLTPDRHVRLALTGPNRADVTAIATHPLGQKSDIHIEFQYVENGLYQSATPLPQGRWLIRWTVRADGRTLRFVERVG